MDTTPSLIRDLGDGLALRAATAVDAELLAAFVGDVLRAQDSDTPDHRLAAWTLDLLEGHHPSFGPGDATVVVDTRTQAIVSCMHLVSQTWAVRTNEARAVLGALFSRTPSDVWPVI